MRVAARFISTQGDLREVMRTILVSPEFKSAGVFQARIKTPYEFIVSAVRATGAEVQDAQPLVRALQQLAMPLYQCQPPTGYRDSADAWVNTGALVNRMNFAVALANNRFRGISIADPLSARTLIAPELSESTRDTIAKAATPAQALAETVGPTRNDDAFTTEDAEDAEAKSCFVSPLDTALDALSTVDEQGAGFSLCVLRVLRGRSRGRIMFSRRIFLKDGALALVSLGFAPSFLARTAIAAAGSTRRKQLIAIFQRGAVDGLSMVVPFGEPEYYRARPSIGIAPPAADANTAIDLDGFFGLNPRLQPLKPLWDARRLAIVHACGSPDNTRSHFDAQDYMETATPGVKSTPDGWLNRCLQVRADESRSPFRAVAVTPQLPRMLHGRAPALALNQLAGFDIRGGRAADGVGVSFETEYAAAADRLLHGTGGHAFEAIRMLKAADPAQYRAANGADYPRSPFGQALLEIAQLVKADVGLEVAFAELGGWDTHVNQGSADGQLAARLDDFAHSIAALVADLGDRMEDIVIVTMSEFGRAVNENGNRGTDHGHGNAMMLIGGPVRGGRVYGRWPGLAGDQRYEGRDVAVTTDFRDVFGEIVARHMGIADTKAVFPRFQRKESGDRVIW